MHLENNNTIAKVAIFGSSSQVGSSIALYFKRYALVEPICFIRSVYSKPFFDILGIQTEIFDLNNVTELKHKLEGITAVLDFTYPAGQSNQTASKIKETTKAIIGVTQPNTVYIYMSSIMAYGMPDMYGKVKQFKFPRGIYGLTKRKAEHYVNNFGKQQGVKVYNFRLGQVHGFLQSVNASFRQKMEQNPTVSLKGSPDSLTNTVFISSLGEAILQCIRKEVKPGTYGIVSYPQWTLNELYGFYLQYYNLTNKLSFKSIDKLSFFKSTQIWLIGQIKIIRPFIESYVLSRFPKLSILIKGKYRQLEAKKMAFASTNVPFTDYHILGELKYSSIKNISSSFSEVWEKEKEMESFYESIIDERKIGS